MKHINLKICVAVAGCLIKGKDLIVKLNNIPARAMFHFVYYVFGSNEATFVNICMGVYVG